ncbi:hypothetical protein ACEWY4_008585 [Coilia grayii]|uniref:Delta-like protein n=1 Tax=Coilia grayii TaxID=363190 RepID=A0ABD1KBE5_9TELE
MALTFLLPCFLTVLLAPMAESSGLFELKVHSFSSTGSVCKPSRECRIFFRVCLKHSQDVISPEPPCTYGTGETDLLSADDESISKSLPLKVPFHFKWPGTFSLIVEAWSAELPADQYLETRNTLITRLAARRRLLIGEEWSQYVHFGQESEMRLSYHVVCDENYHGENCSTFCRPRDDTFGHFKCDAAGVRVCLPGWKGEYCTKPICSSGCSESHGFCDQPGECKCRLGWEGPSCDQCSRHPSCKHGTCSQPWQCNCKEGWGGLFCDQDLNFCTNHKPCKNGATCTNTGQGSYTCTCQKGFTGDRCEKKINVCDSNPCKNGGSCKDMVDGYSCSCPQGFSGKNCEDSSMRCADAPCFNGGTCTEKDNGYSCACPAGYTGSNCEKKVDHCSNAPCANGGQCVDLGHSRKCQCRPGFRGANCEINIDECARNPCRHAGTCVDGINDYTCTCPLGYTGKNCHIRADVCSQNPCQNGGTCFTHFSGPVCQCPADFMGSRCEFARPTAATAVAEEAVPGALALSFTLGLITLTIVVCAVIMVLHQMRGNHKAKALASSVRNDLDAANNRNSLNTVSSSAGCWEKEAFLITCNQEKASNKNILLSPHVLEAAEDRVHYKNMLADGNLTKDKEFTKNNLDINKSETSIFVPPVNLAKEGLYQPIYIISQTEQCVLATEV